MKNWLMVLLAAVVASGCGGEDVRTVKVGEEFELSRGQHVEVEGTGVRLTWLSAVNSQGFLANPHGFIEGRCSIGGNDSLACPYYAWFAVEEPATTRAFFLYGGGDTLPVQEHVLQLREVLESDEMPRQLADLKDTRVVRRARFVLQPR